MQQVPCRGRGAFLEANEFSGKSVLSFTPGTSAKNRLSVRHDEKITTLVLGLRPKRSRRNVRAKLCFERPSAWNFIL